MITPKNRRQIEKMKQGGRRLAAVLNQVLKAARPGTTLKKLDQLAEELIKKAGGQPSFKTVPHYHWATCLNVNQSVVHGIPSDYQLKKGDLLSVDVGNFYQGWHTDMARTIVVGEPPQGLKKKFLQTGQKALKKAIAAAQPGKRVGHISAAMEKVIRQAGFQPVKTLVGHGIGQKLHEPPQIHCFLAQPMAQTPLLKAGMTLAIEVIYVAGQPELTLASDNWTVATADGKLAGLFEDTVAITNQKPVILTAENS